MWGVEGGEGWGELVRGQWDFFDRAVTGVIGDGRGVAKRGGGRARGLDRRVVGSWVGHVLAMDGTGEFLTERSVRLCVAERLCLLRFALPLGFWRGGRP